MILVQKIVSRGVAGVELAALDVARLCGVATGGSTRIFRGRRWSEVIHRYGLAADPCSRRESLLRNIRQADGTLVFGRFGHFGRALEALLKAEQTHYCCLELFRENAVGRVVDWLKRHGIRTLNIMVGRSGEEDFFARVVMLEVLQALGHKPTLPPAAAGPMTRAAVIAGQETCYAVIPWPVPAAWEWRETIGDWQAVADWKRLPCLCRPSLAWVGQRLWTLVPPHVRQWVICEYDDPWDEDGEGSVIYDLGLLEMLGRLGKPAEDLARAGRWAILRLVHESCAVLRSQQGDRAAWDSAAALLTRRQRDIVRSLGFPATESAVRILAKVPRESCSIEVLTQLRALVCDPVSQRVLQSLPIINREVVSVLSDPWLRRVAGLRLLYTLASYGDGASVGYDLIWVCWLLERLQENAKRTGQLDAVGTVNSVRSLERVARDLEHRPDAGCLPPPPALPGITGVIEALTDGQLLSAEGEEMRHCAGQYADEIQLGWGLMFRILPNADYGTSRATLQLRSGPDGMWQVAQLRGVANTPPDPGTERFVKTWLFFAHCDPAASESELARSCSADLAVAVGIPSGRAA